MAAVFYIVRHGQTDWNAQRKIQGQTDISLNAIGKEEALQLAETFKEIPFSICVTSDLKRCYETASLCFKGTIATDSRLRERNFRAWEGKASI